LASIWRTRPRSASISGSCGSRFEPDFGRRILQPVQLGHLGDQLVQAEMRQLHVRRARVFAEGVDHLLHGIDLLHDGVRGALEQLRILGVHAAQQLAPQRSADSWIGVSGFLISCARRRATSPQAASRCAAAAP
jgi:hypothetical protein